MQILVVLFDLAQHWTVETILGMIDRLSRSLVAFPTLLRLEFLTTRDREKLEAYMDVSEFGQVCLLRNIDLRVRLVPNRSFDDFEFRSVRRTFPDLSSL
jgi:hypothetical protein